MEFLDYLIVFFVGVWVGKKLHDLLFRAMLARAMKELGITEEDLAKLAEKMTRSEEDPDNDGLDAIDIKIEQHNGALYAFRKDNDAFLGQGDSREDLINRLAEKMKNVRLLISKEDGGELIGGNFHYNVENGKITGEKQ